MLTLLLAAQLRRGLEVAGASLLDPGVALGALAIVALAGLWRLASMVDAFTSARRRLPVEAAGSSAPRSGRGVANVVLSTLIAIVLAVHGVAAYYAWSFYTADSVIFGSAQSIASSVNVRAGSSPAPSPTPSPAPTGRVTILIGGTEKGFHNADPLLTDTLLVVSVDPVTHTAAMISVPRDTSDFPLYFGGTYQGKINSLLENVMANPKAYPDGPVTTLTREVGYLVGIPVQYYAQIDLNGFESLINLVGGIDVTNPTAIVDPRYSWLNGSHGFYLSAGPHHLDGSQALAYVRSRLGVGENDYVRSARQQQVLVALKQRLTSPAMLPKLPAILQAAEATIQTNFPGSEAAAMVSVAKSVPKSAISRVVLGPPYSYHPPSATTGGIWTSRLYMSKVAALSVKFFGAQSRYYSPPAASRPSAAP